MTNTRVATRLHLATFIDALCSKSILLCLNAWRISFSCSTAQEYYFLTLRNKNCKPL